MSEHLIETMENGVCTLTMNRPEARNAMSGSMMQAMSEAIPRVAADKNVRAVVLTGAGGAFCAGGDVKGFAAEPSKKGGGASPTSLEERIHGLRQGMEISRLLHEMPKPTLAIIPGPAAGAGLSLALACDLRFALDTAKITTAFSKIGASGDYGGSFFLPYLVGAAKAKELYFSADVITGQQAYDMGMVTKIASAETFADEAKAYGEYLASLPTVAVGYMKKNINAAQHGSINDVFDLEAAHMMRCFQTEDHKSAAKAFVNKEAPVFNGR
ncbi:MAG: 2-(1,2-epoxy-1,2-dihydrophenyl)acetyl-CoA isomerase [Candidatus Azotimanducaceae bacterium]|jgi:2-(1,2-epoxy-1,2-dihydrophenyl)acetyl-CoA isomerase